MYYDIHSHLEILWCFLEGLFEFTDNTILVFSKYYYSF